MEAVVCAGNGIERAHLHLRAGEVDDAEALRKLRVVRIHDAGVDVLRPGRLQIFQNLVPWNRFNILVCGLRDADDGKANETTRDFSYHTHSSPLKISP